MHTTLHLHTYAPRETRRGAALIELMISVALFSVVMLSAMAMIETGRKFSASTLESTQVEDLAQQMLFRFEHELASANANQKLPHSSLDFSFGPTATGVIVASTLGFPPAGTLIVDRGHETEERISYTGHTGLTRFTGITRGVQCTEPQNHVVSTGDPYQVMWAGLAVPIDDQTAPAVSQYDGISLENGRPVFFRGDGVGFSYQTPIDPAGGNNVLNGDDVFWGSSFPPVGPSEDGWMALYFLPKTVFDETDERHDLNGDGDQLDTFDIGQLRRASWDTTDPTRVEDVAMGPSAVIQEQCNWGGDLDGDGFDDPIFLWDSNSNLLHVRLHVIGASRKLPISRLVESVIFLRNEPEL